MSSTPRLDRGPQHLAYDFWWHLGHDTMLTSEWGTPNMVEDGLNPELLGQYSAILSSEVRVANLHQRDVPSDFPLKK